VGASADLVAPLANMLFAALKVAHERSEQDQSDTSGTDGDHLRPPVDAGPGARQPRVAGASIRPGRGGGSAGLAGVKDRRDRRRSWPFGSLGRATHWLSGGGQSGVPGRGGCDLWPGGRSPGAFQRRPGAPVGTGPPDRHAGHESEQNWGRGYRRGSHPRHDGEVPEPDSFAAGNVYQLRVVLRGVSPLIWRRLLVRSDSTIADLHAIFQLALGWSDEHLNRVVI